MKSTLLKLPASMTVNHMESDRLSNGEILFSANFIALYTTDGDNITDVFDFRTIDEELISIWGFTQTSEYDLVFVDANNHCLRLYNRMPGTINKFAGSCDYRYPGFRDGTDALFYIPSTVIQDNKTPCFILCD